MNRILIGVLLCAPLLLWGGIRTVKAIQFDQNCGGYLKRAADANTVEMAERELRQALTYANANGLTDGYTSVLWRTPDEDIGFWHNNLTESLVELESVQPQATQLERSNVLMKLRETLLDEGDKGTHITKPEGISVYPNNAGYAAFGWLSLVLSLIGCGFLLRELTDV